MNLKNKKSFLYLGILAVAGIFSLSNVVSANAAYRDMPVTGTNDVDLIIHATDKYSGVKYAYVRNEGKWNIEGSRKQIGTDQAKALIKNGDTYTYKGWKINNEQGPHVVCVALQDAADTHIENNHGYGNRSDTNSGFCNEIYLDKEAPKEVKIVLNNGNPWTNKDEVKAEITVSDNWAGLESIKYTDNGGSEKTVSLEGANCSRDDKTGVQTCKISTTLTLNSETTKGFSEVKFKLTDKVGHSSTTSSHYMYFDKGGLDGKINIYSDKYSSGNSQVAGSDVYFGYEASDNLENKNNRLVSGIQTIIIKQKGTTDEQGQKVYKIDPTKDRHDPQDENFVPYNPKQVLTKGLTNPNDRMKFNIDADISNNNKEYIMQIVIVDRAGNRTEIDSKKVTVNFLKITAFQLTNVVNPEVYSSADSKYNNFTPISWSKPTNQWNDLEEMGFLGTNLFNKDGEVQPFLLGTNFDYTLRWQWTGNPSAKTTVSYQVWMINTSSGTCQKTNINQIENCAYKVKGASGIIDTVNNPQYFLKDESNRVNGYKMKVQLPNYDDFKENYSRLPYDTNTRVYVEAEVTVDSNELLETDNNQQVSKTLRGRFPILTNTNRTDSKAYIGYLSGDIEDYLWFNEEN